MPMEKKVKTAEEKAFNKLWGKKTKLNPSYHLLRKDVGKAPRCNTAVKAEKPVAVTPNKKKR